MIGHGVVVNTITSMNRFTTSKAASWCSGTLWFPPPFGWGTFWSPPDLGSGSACTMSDSGDRLMTDIWRLSNGGAIAPAGCCGFGSGARAMTVSAQLRFFGGGTLVVRIGWSRRAWRRRRTSCRMSKSSSSILHDTVDSPRSSLSSLLISRLISSSSCFFRIIGWTLAVSNTILEGWVGCRNIWLAMEIGCLLSCTCKCSLQVSCLIILWIVTPHLVGGRFHDWWSEVGNVEGSVYG